MDRRTPRRNKGFRGDVKMTEYKWEIYELHKEGKTLKVASGSSRNKQDAEKELNHYAIQYAQDYPIKVKKNWNEGMMK